MNSKKLRSMKNLTKIDPNWPQMDINELFIEACANGDYQAVDLILKTVKNFDIDITDNLGRTALRLAVANEHIEVLQVLLPKLDNQKLREALLLAIYMGHTIIADFILKLPQYKLFSEKKVLDGETDSFWQTPSSDDAQFSPDITPIMLASQYNRTEIVQILLSNGDRIEKPHEFYCTCNECSNRFQFDSLRHAQSRLNAYKGIASESYISLASIDPILTAFELGHELRFLSEKEKYFKSDYLKLAEELSEYVVKLLNNVRGRDELEIFLNKTGKEHEEKYALLARIDLAINYQEMPFVAHPNCQQKLDEIWHTGLRKITKMNQLFQILLLLAFVAFIPFGSIIYIILPNSKVGRFLTLPYIKFLSFSVSYFVFIVILIMSDLQYAALQNSTEKFSVIYSQYYETYLSYVENTNLTYRFPATDMYFRRDMPFNIDIIICIWVFGLNLRETKKLFIYGIRDYMSSWNNILVSMMHLLFFFSYALKYYTIVILRLEKDKLSDPMFWSKVGNLNGNIESQKEVYQTFYWLNEDRFYWFALDPMNLSEALFALAIILTFARLCFWIPINQNLGPLQITLGAMISDILKFICIFLIVFTGFLFGLNNIYWYYAASVRGTIEIEPRTNYPTHAELKFGTLQKSLITIFFAIYTYSSMDEYSIEPFHNQLTPLFGLGIFGFYHITNITILMSMLIAMLTKSFDSIMEHSDVQWKFSRSKLYIEFIKEGSVLPIPLNIIPTPALIVDSIKRKIFSNKNTQTSKESPSYRIDEISHSRPNVNSGGKKKQEDELTFKKVMERIAKRFLLHNHREKEEVKESDFDELKQEVQMVRFEMGNDLIVIKENLARYAYLLHTGMSLLGDYFLKKNQNFNEEIASSFENFRSKEKIIRKINQEM